MNLDALWWFLFVVPWIGWAWSVSRRGSASNPAATSAEPAPQDTESSFEISWLAAFQDSAEAVALFGPAGELRAANPQWKTLFGESPSPALKDALGPHLAAAHSRHPEKFEIDRSMADETPGPFPLGQETAPPLQMSVLAVTLEGEDARIVLSSSNRARDLAVLTRQLAHNLNNLLSAIVGTTGMVMDSISETAPAQKDLLKIEDIAMETAEMTAELQRAAREIAPP